MCLNSSVTCPTAASGGFGTLFEAAVTWFAAAQCAISEGIIPDYDVQNNETFDIIIVGAGSAGCILANRLSEVQEWKVLLIEAGDDPPLESNVPYLDQDLYETEYDWSYLTANNSVTNQENFNGSIYWPRGKMIGGSSNINKLLYIQGSDQDYQTWYDLGNPEWSVEEVRRCFKLFESYQDMEALKTPEIANHYGLNGSLALNTYNSTTKEIAAQVLLSINETGIKNVDDINVANCLGSGYIIGTVADGVRQSANRAFLNPIIANRDNLVVLKNTFATKLLINETTKVAYGVEVERNSSKYQYLASKEVIVSAGAIGSPQLLMLSGIGPQEQLTSSNISVISDSPMVGQNLQDHLFVFISICADVPGEQNENDLNFGAIEYLYNRTGYLASTNTIDIAAFYSLQENASYPDYELNLLLVPKNSSTLESTLTNNYRFQKTIVNSFLKLNANHSLYLFVLNLLHPKSKGNITLSSNNPYDHPIINPNYFIESEDLTSITKGIQFITNIVNTPFFQNNGGFLARIDWPPCNGFELNSTEYWECISTSTLTTGYHPLGTCQIGPNPDTSVVDSRLRVHGIQNLRVIDASIMPNATSGNTNGPTIMIGQRASELVKEDHNITVTY